MVLWWCVDFFELFGLCHESVVSGEGDASSDVVELFFEVGAFACLEGCEVDVGGEVEGFLVSSFGEHGAEADPGGRVRGMDCHPDGLLVWADRGHFHG